METNRAKEIIVSILQRALTGQLDASSNVNPQFIADAIATKIDFGKSYTELKNDRIISTLIEAIMINKNSMKNEFEKLTEKEKLLANFIKGKLTAYEEILNTINKL